MYQYIDLCKNIIDNGNIRKNRTGIDSKSIFGYQMKFNLEEGYPLLTTKTIHFRSVVYELLWFLKGETNISYLNKNNVNIWNEWADNNGDLGPIYGSQWRHWKDYKGGFIDQIQYAIDEIQNNPYSRRIIVSAWNVAQLNEMALYPCHVLFQFYVNEDKLSLQLYQRSADVFLGLPFNIASYSLLLIMISNICNLKPSVFIHTIGDAHIYMNHMDNILLQISRDIRPLPNIVINKKIKNIFNFEYEDIVLLNYYPHSYIKGDVAI